MAEISERRLLLLFVAALAVIAAAATFAIRTAKAPETVALMELPLATQEPFNRPATEACEAAGGTVRYERVSECFDTPDVHDACSFPGVICFTDGSGATCREARASYCVCATDDQCPSGYECEGPSKGEKRCLQTSPGKPIKAVPMYR
ncbi:hypothetical protein EPO34_01950 [Patescibacteria group bacterium]|nr:MAG: hypothetical protein EPO34_01950 [Patescibacteria group bacterium]